MQKLAKNTKAILGAVTLALFGFAGAKTGVVVLQQQPLDSASLRSSVLRGHAALSRLPAAAFRAALVKSRRAANNLIGASCITSFSHRLCFAGVTSHTARFANGQALPSSASPRAPPIS